MADDADARGDDTHGAGGTNAPPPASATLGEVNINLLEPLERAAGAGDATLTGALLAAGTMVPIGANAAEERPLRRTILHWAAFGGSSDVVRAVLRAIEESGIAAAGENEIAAISGGNSCPAEGATSFAANGATAEALKASCLSKPGGTDGTRPLHLAAEGGHVAVAVALIQHGASIDPVDEDGRIPLTISLDLGHDEMALELVRRGRRNVNLPISLPEETALHYAAWRGCLPVVELLLSKGASVNAIDITRSKPFMSAAMSGPNAGKVIKALLAAGANVHEPSGFGDTALFHAVKFSDHPGPAIRALIARGVEPHEPCSSGFSAVQEAALDNNVDALSVLLELGVDPDTRFKLDDEEYGGASLLDLAARRLSVGAVELLLSAGANDGITATGLDPVLIELGQYAPGTSVPADDVGIWADQVTPLLTKAEYERRSAAILPMLARAKFFRKGWLAVLRARCDAGKRLTDTGWDGSGPPQARKITTSEATSIADGNCCAFVGSAVAAMDDRVWHGACVWLAMVPDEEIFRMVVDWL